MANVHPWFANVSVDDAAGWTADFFQETDVDAANAVSNRPKMYIAETGEIVIPFCGFSITHAAIYVKAGLRYEVNSVKAWLIISSLGIIRREQ